jgi:hypothetical protein
VISLRLTQTTAWDNTLARRGQRRLPDVAKADVADEVDHVL